MAQHRFPDVGLHAIASEHFGLQRSVKACQRTGIPHEKDRRALTGICVFSSAIFEHKLQSFLRIVRLNEIDKMFAENDFVRGHQLGQLFEEPVSAAALEPTHAGINVEEELLTLVIVGAILKVTVNPSQIVIRIFRVAAGGHGTTGSKGCHDRWIDNLHAADRVGCESDTSANLTEASGPLVDCEFNASSEKACSERQAYDASADNRNVSRVVAGMHLSWFLCYHQCTFNGTSLSFQFLSGLCET